MSSDTRSVSDPRNFRSPGFFSIFIVLILLSGSAPVSSS